MAGGEKQSPRMKFKIQELMRMKGYGATRSIVANIADSQHSNDISNRYNSDATDPALKRKVRSYIGKSHISLACVFSCTGDYDCCKMVACVR